MAMAADRPIRLRVEFTRYRHLGAHSGYGQFLRHLPKDRFRVVQHGASDSDADLPAILTPLRPWLRSRIARGGMPWYKLSDLTAELRALPACLAGRHDIVHFLDGEHSAQFLPRWCRRAPLPTPRTVATFHQPPEVLGRLINPGLLRWLDRIVLVSPSQRAFFAAHVSEERLRVILHGVDDDFFHPGKKANEGGGIRCITAGHWLRDWEIFEGVAKALAEVEAVRFDVVSGGRPELARLPNVTLHNGLGDQELAGLYRSADVLFLPLVDATANNCFLEGLSSGLAAVTTDLEATRAYLPNGAGLLVENRVDAFVGALTDLAHDVPLRRRLAGAARARSRELAWRRLVRDYQDLYRELAA
jgi:glycosyltransferase involved in cell wall biosynthesis